MTKFTIYYNPRCSKSRQALALLQQRNIDPEIVDYLKTPLSAAAIQKLLGKLGMSARDILRTKEAEFKQLGLDILNLSDDEIVDLIVKNPKLLERPIVENDNQAALGRPPENILKLLD